MLEGRSRCYKVIKVGKGPLQGRLRVVVTAFLERLLVADISLGSSAESAYSWQPYSNSPIHLYGLFFQLATCLSQGALKAEPRHLPPWLAGLEAKPNRGVPPVLSAHEQCVYDISHSPVLRFGCTQDRLADHKLPYQAPSKGRSMPEPFEALMSCVGGVRSQAGKVRDMQGSAKVEAPFRARSYSSGCKGQKPLHPVISLGILFYF